MKRFLFIDTQIFIQCCLLEVEDQGQIQEIFSTLSTKLKDGTVSLILPELVKLEFSKVLTRKIKELKQNVQKLRKIIKDNEISLGGQLIKETNEGLNNSLDTRIKNSENLKKTIEKIFNDEKTINISLSQNHFVAAYKDYAAGKKPTKQPKLEYEATKEEKNLKIRYIGIQSDALIIAALEQYLNTQTDYELLFCSGNTDDFASSKEVENPTIHQDIQDRFKNIKYYTNLPALLNIEFSTQLTPEVIEKLKTGINENIEEVSSSSLGENISEPLAASIEITGPASSI